MLRRLRTLSERECYARCYGAGDEAVRIVPEPARPRPTGLTPERGSSSGHLTGEELRRRFEERLEARESRAA